MRPKIRKAMMPLLIVILISSLVAVLGGSFYIYKVVQDFDKVFAQHVYVENIPIGGLTFEAAEVRLKEELIRTNQEIKLNLTYQDKSVAIPLSEFRPTYPIKATLEMAYKEGHDGDFVTRYRTAKHGIEKNKNFHMKPTFSQDSVAKGLMNHTTTFYEAPIDATIERKNRQFIITPEKLGSALDVTQTSQIITDALQASPNTIVTVEATIKPLTPATTSELLQQVETPIASFYTSYNNTDWNRNQNLVLAAQKINCVLKPGDIFSLGNQIEPITYEAGYRASKVIVDGKLEEGIGGGVCQIASTLYNAVLLSKLDIVARANHSLPVAYVPLGRDATYASESIDFRFQNNTEYPVFIESYCENNRVYVNIFSHTSLKEPYDSIKFTSETVKVTDPPPTKIIEDSTLYEDQRIQETTALPGKTVKLYKLCYKNGELVHKELVNTSYYRERGEVVKVGTKARAKHEIQPNIQETFSDIGIETTTILNQQ